MILYLLRHGIAVERETQGYKTDSARPLTKEGEEKMKQVAQGMLTLGLDFDWILSSPYIRAKQTAEIVANAFDQKVEYSTALADGNHQKLVDELNERALHTVLLVGHEPFMSELVSTLISGDSQLVISFKKGGMCRLTAPHLSFGRCARLDWLLSPRHFRRIRPAK